MFQYLADDQLQNLLATHREKLQVLELQALDQDPLRVPIGLINEINHAKAQMSAITLELTRRTEVQKTHTQPSRRCPGCTSDVPYGQHVCSHCGAQLRF